MTPRLLAPLAVAAVLAACAPGPDEAASGWTLPAGAAPARSNGGMVATTDRVASEIGAEILRRGGNAVDAAVAIHFALAVINPEAGNLGGGGFLVIHTADGVSAALDFRETAPARASRDMYLDSLGEVTENSVAGHLASGVPGSVAGMYEAHRRFGSLPWPELVQPAIHLAEGVVVHERLASSLGRYADRLREYAATEAAFLPGGEPPRVGDRFSQPDLAATLGRVAAEGSDGFYRGRTAELIVAEMEQGGGLITQQDLAAYRAVWRTPVSFTYRGHRVISMPPPSSGGATLGEILKILEGYELAESGHHSPRHIHLFSEAAKRGFADRNAYLADPDFVAQPVARMVSEGYADRRRARIQAGRATPSEEVSPGLGPAPGAGGASESEHTTHYSVLDAAGNAVAVTTTINSLYGSRVTVAGAGFLLNNEMDDFTSKPGVPNQFGLVQGAANEIEPGKRMLSAMTPTIVLGPDGGVRLITGSPGGPTIITTVAQLISNLVDFGMTLEEATRAPRLHHQHLPDVLRYEVNGVAPAVVAELERMGHRVEERGGYQGDAQSIGILPDGVRLGVADPRRGGAAVGVRVAREVVQ